MAGLKITEVRNLAVEKVSLGISPVNFVEDVFCAMVLDIERVNVLKQAKTINLQKLMQTMSIR